MPAKQAQYLKIVTTSIPKSSSAEGKSLAQLLVLATETGIAGGVATNEALSLDELSRVVDWVLLGELPIDGTTDRGAVNVASIAAMTRKYQVAAAAEFGPSVYGNLPCGAGKISATEGPWFEAAADAAIAAAFMVWIA